MKKYQVLQGKMDNQGNGQIDLIEEFETKADAIKFFNSIKNDKRGYGKFYSNEHLETWLLKENNWDDPVGYWSC